MISYLEIENFKCFAHLRLSFGALTLLTGFNGGGKSTAIHPILLLAQSYMGTDGVDSLMLNGSLVRLGTVGDVLPADAKQSVLTFKASSESEEITWVTKASAGDRHLSIAKSASQHHEATESVKTTLSEGAGVVASLMCIAYISAIREGTSDAYPMPEVESNTIVNVGPDGRFAPYWYYQFADDEVVENRRHPKEPASSFRKQLDAWLSSLFPGAQADVSHMPQVSLESLRFRQTNIGSWRRPANIGYGFTYAFPIIVQLLGASEGQTVVIDSPEAHLHPSAQSQMGRLLAFFAAAGVQIIVETHSDHLLNGARLAVKERALKANKLQIHFFTGADNTSHGVVSPAVNSEGQLSNWPDGFFDQSEKDLIQLSGWE
ncbi:DUF3696 domain-containing protein [uncultured Propionivibrio sp.]|uniref:AAA family ATPase n=1 Tax=uncultured Propionivibrio sp. TaxID=426737 RepID=UPI0029C047A6|nr:DUF3696 domain-containing protein [uncultured Propionivibrio sp.]